MLFFKVGAVFSVRGDRLLNLAQQLFLSVGLLYEVDRAALHGFNGHRNIAVAGNEDNWQNGVSHVQLALKLHAVHAGHTDIQYHTAGHIGGEIL